MCESKKCTTCGEVKPLSEYYTDKGRPIARCKLCSKFCEYNRYQLKAGKAEVTFDEYKEITKEYALHQERAAKDKKKCPRCKKVLPKSQFYVKEKSVDGTTDICYAYCKACTNAPKKAARKERAERRQRLIANGLSICSCCDDILPLASFCLRISKHTGLTYPDYCCKDCNAFKNWCRNNGLDWRTTSRETWSNRDKDCTTPSKKENKPQKQKPVLSDSISKLLHSKW